MGFDAMLAPEAEGEDQEDQTCTFGQIHLAVVSRTFKCVYRDPSFPVLYVQHLNVLYIPMCDSTFKCVVYRDSRVLYRDTVHVNLYINLYINVFRSQKIIESARPKRSKMARNKM